MSQLLIKDYLKGFKGKEVRILSKAMSLAESTLDKDKELLAELLKEASKSKKISKVIGITGTPGVGKSTFLNSLGKFLIDNKKSLAILSIDPSSEKSGGSILGDKTRMDDLVGSHDVYIRPSSSGTLLGGVAASTKDAIELCEFYGFDYIFVESVGVGQSELLLSKMVDFMILLLAPGGGDDIQGIKRGLLEHVDQIVINKNDGDFKSQAMLTAELYRDSSPSEPILVSSLENTNLDKVHSAIESKFQNLEAIKKDRYSDLFWDLVEIKISERVKNFKKTEKGKKIRESYEKKNRDLEKSLNDILNLI